MSAIRSSALCAMSFCVATAGLAPGCAHDPVHQIDMQVDCQDDCNRYRDCYDSHYDTAACQNRCHDVVDHDPNAANACDSCLDAHSCTTAPFACSGECNGIIP
jgi:hypothetical protein